MRNLRTSDLFSLSKIIKKMNIKEDIKALVKNITNLNTEERKNVEKAMQIDLVMLFVENISTAEKEVYKLFADISNKSTKEIEEMGISEFIKLVQDLFNQEDIGDFLSMALK